MGCLRVTLGHRRAREPWAVDPLLKKLQYRPGTVITVLSAPAELAPTIDAWSADGEVRTRLARDCGLRGRLRPELGRAPRTVGRVVPKLADEAVLWMSYPKKSSAKYRSDLSRDDSWRELGDLGFEPVRQVAVDADWSALRFRRAEQIPELARDPAGRCRLPAAAGPRVARPPSTSSSPVPGRVVRR